MGCCNQREHQKNWIKRIKCIKESLELVTWIDERFIARKNY